MERERKRKRRQAMMLGEHSLIIDVTEQELELIRKGKIALEKIKHTPNLTIYRKKR